MTWEKWRQDTYAAVLAAKNMIKLHDIHKYYRTGEQSLHVLKGVDLHIREGELVSIMGSSGSGKSTLLNILGVLDGVRPRQLRPGGSAGQQSGGDRSRAPAQQAAGVRVPVLQPAAVQERRGERGAAALLPGRRPQGAQLSRGGVPGHGRLVRPQDLHAQSVVGWAEAARGHRARAGRQSEGDPCRRAHGRSSTVTPRRKSSRSSRTSIGAATP